MVNGTAEVARWLLILLAQSNSVRALLQGAVQDLVARGLQERARLA